MMLINSKDYHDDEGKRLHFYSAIMNDQDLRSQLIDQLSQKRKLSFQLKKFTCQSSKQGEQKSKMRKLKDTKARNVIEFDKEGQVVRDKLQVLQERPRYKIYSIADGYEYCNFCKSSSRDEELRIKCGPMYGPIKLKDREAYVHELCALWTPEIFLDDKNKFKNLAKAIKRCKKIKCTLCKEKGGGLGCYVKTCDKSYHYLCAKVSNCLFVNSKFIIYCENHRSEAPDEYLEEEKIEEEQDEQLQHYICTICKSGLDERHIVICEGCDRGFHSNCHQPPVNLDQIDEDEDWYCQELLMPKHNYTQSDRNPKQNSRPGFEGNSFVRDDQNILKYVAPGDKYSRGGKQNQRNHNDYEEEKKQVNGNKGYSGKYGSHEQLEESIDDDQYYQPSGQYHIQRGGYNSSRGRGRGLDSRNQDYNHPEGQYKQKARFAERGRGRGRGGNNYQSYGRDSNHQGFGQPIDFQVTKQKNRGRGRGDRTKLPDYNNNHWVEDDQFEEDQNNESYAQYQNVADDEIFQPRFLQSQKQDIEELFEEKVIQDRRTINLWSDYMKPEFYQGPQYIIYRSMNSQQRKKRIYSSELQDIQFQSRAQFEQSQQKGQQYGKTDKWKLQEVYGQDFDFKKEKRVENSFWTNDHSKTKKTQKDSRTRNNQKKDSRGKGKIGQVQGKPIRKFDGQKDKLFNKQNRGQGKQQYNGKGGERKNYEEYIDDKQIKKGLADGTLFEGILRVSQYNRKRAFVQVNDIVVDVMIDGLNSQNRALDGDTVIISLLDPSKWTKFTSNNVVVGKDSLGQANNAGAAKGYTNETAIETRIIDLETLGQIDEKDPDVEELKEITEEFKRQKEQEKQASSKSSSSQSSHSSGSDDESDDNDEELKKDEAIDKAEAKEVSNSGEESDEVGYDYLKEDQQVSSSEEDVQIERPKQNLRTIKEEITDSAKKERVQKQEIVKQPLVVSQFTGKTKQEKLSQINLISKDLRPLGLVKAIVKSPNRDKEHLVTLIKLENIDFDEKQAKEIQSLYDTKKNAASCGVYAVPVSKKLPWMALQTIPEELVSDIQNKKKLNQRYYIVKMVAWRAFAIRPVCNVISSIGEAGNLDAESLRILKMHDIWSDEYETEGQKLNEKVHESLRIFTKDIDPISGEWIIPQEEIERRVDLREKRIFTIDPITAKDLDDALSIDKISDFIYEIGVHIADVSYFVQQGTELDKEAQLRCTSVYFVHKVYPMLPRLLCERLCSLNPKVDRLAYSIFFRMDIRTGQLEKGFTPRICRTVIRTCAKWHYQLVQDILDGKITNESQLETQHKPIDGVKFSDMRDDCFLMNEIAQKRRKKRLENGSILLQNREFCFLLDGDTKMPQSFQESYRIESKFLVEEYMLLANILIAEHLHQYCKDKTLLRVHPDIEDEKKTKLKEFFDKVGLQCIDLTDSQTLSVSLEALRDTGDSAKFNVAMRKFLTCLQCAKYMCINDATEKEYMHFGLNFQLYTHFTSPIRRYADLLVHRLVTLTIQHKDATRDLIELMDYSNYADLCSEKSYNAKRASQQCTRLFHCLLLKSNGIKVFDSLLFDMDHSSISIYLDEINMHHKIRLRDDPRVESLIFFEEHFIIVALLKTKKSENKGSSNPEEKRDKFKKVKSLEQIHFDFQPHEYLALKIFDKVKVKVETTTEFPLDIQCTLMYTEEDQKEFEQIRKEIEDKANQAKVAAATVVVINDMENLNDEV